MGTDSPRLRQARPWAWLGLGAAALAGLTVAFECNVFGGFAPAFAAVPLDDAWIHFVYAENALRSGLLHYNPGEPAAGTSSLLWVLLLALPLRLGFAAPAVAKVLGLLAQFGLAAAVFALLRRAAGKPLAVIGALLICTDPVMVAASLSGMEATLYALLAFSAAALLMADRPRAAGVVAGLTVIVRPDGAMLAALVIVLGLLHEWRQGKTQPARRAAMPRVAFWLVAPALVFGLAWAYLNWRATGRLLPASFYVRAGGFGLFANLPPVWRIFREFAAAGTFVGHPLQWMLYALGLVWVAFRRDARWWALVLFPWVLAWLLADENLQIIGGTFLGHRYIAPGLPFVLAVQLLGAAFVTDLLIEKRVLHRTYRKRYLPALLAAAALLLLVGDPRVLAGHLAEQRDAHRRACFEIETMQVRIGKWLATGTPPGAVIGTFDAGAIAYFDERETIDILGLNTPGLAPLDAERIARLDYLVTFPTLSETIVASYADRVVFRVELDRATVVAAPEMVVYRVQAPGSSPE
jgi:hypothetical protein